MRQSPVRMRAGPGLLAGRSRGSSRWIRSSSSRWRTRCWAGCPRQRGGGSTSWGCSPAFSGRTGGRWWPIRWRPRAGDTAVRAGAHGGAAADAGAGRRRPRRLGDAHAGRPAGGGCAAYRAVPVGGERVPEGGSVLSYADLAVAVVDEIRTPTRHRTRVSVGRTEGW